MQEVSWWISLHPKLEIESVNVDTLGCFQGAGTMHTMHSLFSALVSITQVEPHTMTCAVLTSLFDSNITLLLAENSPTPTDFGVDFDWSFFICKCHVCLKLCKIENVSSHCCTIVIFKILDVGPYQIPRRLWSSLQFTIAIWKPEIQLYWKTCSWVVRVNKKTKIQTPI